MQSRVGLIVREHLDGITLVVYQDHKDIAHVELTMPEMFNLHEKLTEKLYQAIGRKTRLVD